MSSLKIILRKKKNKDGTYPLALRITTDRKSSYIYLGHSVKESQWDAAAQAVKSSHPNSKRLNNFLLKKRTEASDQALELSQGSSKAIKQKVKPKGGVLFFGQADAYLDHLKASGKYNQYVPDKSRINNLKVFLKGEDIAFSDISVSLLEKFKNHLRATMEISERTVINHMVVIRSVFSFAIKEKVTDKKYYPFGKGMMIIKFPDSTKIGLTAEEVRLIENVELANPQHHHARNLWLISFYFAGMRVSDVFRLKWSDIQDGRLHYSMGKNNKGGSLKIPEKAAAIFQEYHTDETKKTDLIFPELHNCQDANKFEVQKTIAFKTSAIDKLLRLHVAPAAKVSKTVTMHIARHTFGNISGNKIPVQMLQQLYRHSSITTTIGYQSNFIHESADDSLNTVLSF